MLKIEYVFIADNGCFVPLCIAIQSLVENCSTKGHFNNINILYLDLSKRQLSILKSFNCKKNKINLFNCKESYKKNLGNIVATNKNIYRVASETALLKFLIPEILTKVNKSIYLDCDIIIDKDISDVYSVDINDKYAAVVRDLPQAFLPNFLNNSMVVSPDYFNSGFMVLNLKLLRSKFVSKKLIKKKLQMENDTFMDQNVFNVVFDKNVRQLDCVYNVCVANYFNHSDDSKLFADISKKYKKKYRNINDLINDAKVIHYSSYKKPWIYYDVPLVLSWNKYYERSPLNKFELNRSSYIGETVATYKQKTHSFDFKLRNTNAAFPVVFCANPDYIPVTAVAIQSIIHNINKDKKCIIYVLTNSNRSSYFNALSCMSTPNVSIKCINTKYLIDDSKFYTVAHYSRQMFYRWFIPKFFTQYKKIIYLDSDLVVNSDISELYDVELKNNMVGMVQNKLDAKYMTERKKFEVFKILKLDENSYFNSGVILFNADAFRKEKCLDKLLKLLKTSPITYCPDQDIINIGLRGKILSLDSNWNFQTSNVSYHGNERFNKKAKIIHFISSQKPWYPKGADVSNFNEFWKYARDCSFYEIILKNFINASSLPTSPKKRFTFFTLVGKFFKYMKRDTKKIGFVKALKLNLLKSRNKIFRH